MDWSDLAKRLDAAVGADSALDREIAATFGVAEAPFTASVSHCRALVESALPDLRLHLGFSANGLFPYASLVGDAVHVMSEAPTVPLAILRSLAAAAAIAAQAAPPVA
jgi:hypothetical protein